MPAQTFAVFDLETTGLHPGGHDRIIEFAVVTLDPGGQVLDRWETLINPQRDLGPQRIHGLTAAEVRRAPTFADIADEIAYRLDGSVLVAHNLRFDASFLRHELLHAGQDAPDAVLDAGLCTLNLARSFELPRPYSLAALCELMSIVNQAPHAAAGDALATAELLQRYLDLDPEWDGWHAKLAAASALQRRPEAPALRPVAVARRRAGLPVDEPHFLERIATHASPAATSAAAEEYFHLLGTVLLDRVISATEADALVGFAATVGLTRSDCAALHEEYLVALVAAALDDGIITDAEHAELTSVADLLAIDPQRRTELLEEGERRQARQAEAPAPMVPRTGIAPGSRIVLTGQLSRPKAEIAADLENAGYVVADSVTKKVALVVAADPDSMSGKAEKARKYGIPVVGEGFVGELVA
jgi:DNA polymerase III subunit epsilon